MSATTNWRSACLDARQNRRDECRVANSTPGVSGNCKFVRSKAVKPEWQLLKKQAVKLEKKIKCVEHHCCVDVPSTIVFKLSAPVTIPVDTNTTITGWASTGSTNQLHAGNLITTGTDQYFLVPQNGVYIITSQTRWIITDTAQITTASRISTIIEVNGTDRHEGIYHPPMYDAATSMTTVGLSLVTGDKVRIIARHSVGAPSVLEINNIAGTSWYIQKA